MKRQEPAPGAPLPRKAPALVLLALCALGAVLVLPGCMASAPSTTPALPSYVVHVPGGTVRGLVLLVGRSDCPHCQNAKAILANLSVDYYWIDLKTLDQANTTEVMRAVTACKDTRYVPMLVVNGAKCVVGDDEQQIREALA